MHATVNELVAHLLALYDGPAGLAARFGATRAERRDTLKALGVQAVDEALAALDVVLDGKAPAGAGSNREGLESLSFGRAGFGELEAIVSAIDYPTFEVKGDEVIGVDPGSRWARLNADQQTFLQGFIRATGRIENPTVANYAGTGFLVAPDVLITNRHVGV